MLDYVGFWQIFNNIVTKKTEITIYYWWYF